MPTLGRGKASLRHWLQCPPNPAGADGKAGNKSNGEGVALPLGEQEVVTQKQMGSRWNWNGHKPPLGGRT